MALSDLLAKVRLTAQKRATDLTAEYWNAVRAAAAGKPVNADRVAELLERLGKTPDEFERAAELHARRLALAATVAAEPDALKRQAAAERELAKLDTEFRAAEERHRAARRPHEEQAEAGRQASRDASAARGELVETCPYDDIRGRLKAADAETRAAEEKVREWRDRVERLRAATQLRSTLKDDYSAAVESAEKRLPIVRKELADLTAEYERRIAEAEKITDEMRRS